MLIRVGYEIAFQSPQPEATIVMGYLHPTRVPTVQVPERLRVEPRVAVSEYFDLYGNRCGRIVAPAGRVVLRNDAV
ncbi:MAG TPA: transglutaminase family protein, partial [Pirellulales bacterium]|nr:transglutaminase family protein [Pirellulales bacterium]